MARSNGRSRQDAGSGGIRHPTGTSRTRQIGFDAQISCCPSTPRSATSPEPSGIPSGPCCPTILTGDGVSRGSRPLGIVPCDSTGRRQWIHGGSRSHGLKRICGQHRLQGRTERWAAGSTASSDRVRSATATDPGSGMFRMPATAGSDRRHPCRRRPRRSKDTAPSGPLRTA